jgi:transposase
MLKPSGWWLMREPADLRAGAERLLSQVPAGEAMSGVAWVFRNRAGTRLKVVWVDGNGVWLCVRRLHHGKFTWPRAGEVQWSLTVEQMHWLAMGADWQRLSAKVPTGAIL